MKIKLEEMKKRLSETEKISNKTSDVSESNEKKLKLFQYKYARLSRTWREENLSKQHEIETLKANVREFQKQLENIQNSSDSKSFSIRRDLRDILCILHSVTSQIVDEGTSESRLAGEMLHGVIERVNSIMNQNDDEEIKNPLLDDVTASMVKMCQEMEEDSAEKQSVITKLQRALENANSETSTKLLKSQFNKIMSRTAKRRGVLRKQSERMNMMSGSSAEESKSEKKKKKKKKKRAIMKRK